MPDSAADRVIALYDAHAETFARLRRRDLIERAWLDAFLNALPPAASPGERPCVLDLGCGTGLPIAGHLIAEGCRVTGVDGAPAMIARARRAFPGQDWIVADMRALPPLGPFAGIVAWHSFFHLPPADQRPLFATFRRLAAPGAALLFTSGTIEGEAIGRFAGHPLYHGSLDTAEYRARLHVAGFSVLRHVVSDPTCGGATVWLARQASAAAG